MQIVNQPVRKKDAMQLVTGQPVYMDDMIPEDCLIVKLLRSPHANAVVQEIQTDKAMKVPGIEAIYTWKDIDQNGRRFTCAGQTYPEPSPYDRLILDRHVRFVGDPVAIVAGETEKAVDRAISMIKVQYEVLEPILDYHKALDNPILVHPEDNWEALCPVGADNKRNLCAHEASEHGDIDQVLSDCDIIIDQVYHTKACQQTMMETMRTYCSIDTYGRLNVFSSTQIVFHCRRIIANALHIPKSQVRVSKPRIGGGFGTKQTAVCEVYPAYVTWMTKKPSKIIFTREECMTNGSPRHQMQMKVKIGATRDGDIRAIDLYAISNAGAYGEHAPTTIGLVGHKSLSLYGSLRAARFSYDVVYSNTMGAGAYRGYGATQGIYAVESAVSELADTLGIDPTVIREKNMVREGQIMKAYYNEPCNSCALDRCMKTAKEMMDWNNKAAVRTLPNGHLHGVGVALAMQGSGISHVDIAAVELRLNDDGFYTLLVGCTDMGTGCDTILAQMAADILDCDIANIAVQGVDTDQSPYDTGSYASATTYVTGGAVVKTAEKLRAQILEAGADILGVSAEEAEFDGKQVLVPGSGKSISLREIGYITCNGSRQLLSVHKSHSSPISPPPFMVGMAEVDIDPQTGKVNLMDYVAVVDCGTVINKNLARVQTEGGIAQGIGMALYEDIQYNEDGKMINNSFLQYKIPTRLEIPTIRVAFESSYEPTGPFGAKSIGELVINTPSPAIASAIRHATGLTFTTLPITAEQIAMGLLKNPVPEEK